MSIARAEARGSGAWIAALAALVLLAFAMATPAQALTCQVLHPAVRVTVNLAEPVIDNTLPQPALQQLAGKSYHHGRTLGLYRAAIRTQWRIHGGQSDGGGETCRWIEDIAIDIVAPERTIYIVRARPPGTCWYDSVLTHERKHQATDDTVIAEYAPRVQQAVARALAELPPTAPVRSADGAAAQQRLLVPLDAAVRRVLDALETARRARQAAIDSPLEYRRVGAACG
jgi:hypothetical protein